MNVMRIGIIGGGPGGLMTAYRLEQRAKFPCELTLFEAASRLGGKILTPHFRTLPVRYEAGAAELYDYSRLGPDPLRELVDELGFKTRPMWGDAVVLGDRVLHGESDIGRELGEATLRCLREFAARARSHIGTGEYYEPDWRASNEDPLAAVTFASLLDELEDEDARKFLEVSVHSDVATEPWKTNAIYGLQNYLMMHPEYMQLYSIEGGLERLPRELAARIGAKICLNQPVLAVERDEEDDGYLVSSRVGGQIVTEEFDIVVVALPINWIPLIEWRGETLRRAMRKHTQHYSSLAHYLRVSLLFEHPFWRDRIDGSYFMVDGLGGFCVYDETSRDRVDPRGVLGCLLAGDAALTLGNLEDQSLVEHVHAALPASLRDPGVPLLEGRVHRWLGAVSGLPGGHPTDDPDARHVPEPVDHPWLFAVGDYLFDATLNGVLDSADTVVDWILEEVEEHQRALELEGPASLPPESSDRATLDAELGGDPAPHETVA
jgi:glycine/D-amino acid oxidase-like deaminating enzyme